MFLTVRSRLAFAVLWAAAAVIGTASTASHARQQDASEASSTISLAALPPEAQQTARLIRAGGPFPHSKDGSVFGNRERILPTKARGHYREYTVKTPGAKNRGARRIVCGGQQPAVPQACYYTADHYVSFRRIAQ